VLPGEILDKGNRLALVGLLFPAIGLLLVRSAVLSVWRWRKFGQSVFHMASVPGVLGGRLAGVVQTSAKVRPEDGFRLLLRCVRHLTTGSGNQRHTSERILWESQRIAPRELLEDQADQSAIPVVFTIPFACPPSDQRNPDDQTFWRLTATAKMPGIDYSATFEVPVFKTAESDAAFVPDRDAMAEYVAAPAPERELREAGVVKSASPDGDSVRFVFPMARNPGGAAIYTVLGLIFSSLMAVMLNAGVPIYFTVVVGLFDALFLYIMANLWFYRSVVDVSPRELAVRRGLFGLRAACRIAAANVKAIEGRQCGSSSQNDYYNVIVVFGNDKRITLGKRVPGPRLATAIIRQMEQALGRRQAATN
jgi:hypothetical protein